MLITRRSPFSGKEHTLEIDVSPEEIRTWESGTLIQHAMPFVPAEHREFMITGITPEEWDATFGKDED